MGLEFGPNSGDKEITPKQMIALGAVAGLALFGLYKINEAETSHVEKIQSCTSELTGREIKLVVDEDDRIDRPQSIYDEVTACIRARGNTDNAKIFLEP